MVAIYVRTYENHKNNFLGPQVTQCWTILLGTEIFFNFGQEFYLNVFLSVRHST